jgi:epoxyqueuosine reductase QueG
MKNEIAAFITGFVYDYSKNCGIQSRWKNPLTAVADAADPSFNDLKGLISPSHALPHDIIPGARSVLVYFLPFEERLTRSNHDGRFASREWAVAYEETNRLIGDINQALHDYLGPRGVLSSLLPATHNFDRKKLVSDWSHRHVAYIAGLGKFGWNNMLITDKGCCGRIGSVVLDLDLEPTAFQEGEYCLFRYNGTCQKCVERCVNEALHPEDFDRFKCHEMCKENDLRNPDLGLTEVCGKCVVAIPCSHRNPVSPKIL